MNTQDNVKSILAPSSSLFKATRWLPAIGAGALLLSTNACVDEDEIVDTVAVDEPDADEEFRSPIPADRNLRTLNKPIQDALDNLTCAAGPDFDSVANYEFDPGQWAGYHVQSMVYTGPFSNGTARAFYSRSDGDSGYEDYELVRNSFSTSEVRSDGTMNTGSDIGFSDRTNVEGDDHAAQIDWLPDFDSNHGYEAGYVFVAAEDSKDVRIFYYHMDDGNAEDSPSEVTTSSTRLSRQDGGTINQVYITLEAGKYWLVMGESSNFEVWKAAVPMLFPSGPGSLDPSAFIYHGEYSPSSGGGSNCYFVKDSLNDIYRLCYKNSDDDNCDSGDNKIYATEVTITSNSFSIANEVSAEVNLGFWGNSSWDCEASCKGLQKPSFRASGTHYVDEEGDLNVYSLAFGGEGGTCVNAGSSDGKVKACEE